MSGKHRVLIFFVAYNAANPIDKVIGRVPAALLATYDIDVLIIDDASQDDSRTIRRAGRAAR